MPWLALAANFAWLVLTGLLYRQAVQTNAEHSLELEHTTFYNSATINGRQKLDTAHGACMLRKVTMVQQPISCRNQATVTTRIDSPHADVNPATHEPPVIRTQLARRRITASVVNNATPYENMARCVGAFDSKPVMGNYQGFPPPEIGEKGGLRFAQRADCSAKLSAVSRWQTSGRCAGQHKREPRRHNVQKPRQAAAQHAAIVWFAGYNGRLAIGGITFNLTHRRWLAEEASRMKSAFMNTLSRYAHTAYCDSRHERAGAKRPARNRAEKRPWDTCRKRQACARWWAILWTTPRWSRAPTLSCPL